MNLRSEPLTTKSTPQFNTSVPHKDHTFSAPEIPQFHTKTPQFHTKTPQFNTPPQLHSKNPSVPHQKL